MKRILFLSLFFVAYLNVNAQRTNRLDSTGNAGIGILSPTEKLEIYSYGLSNIKLTNYGDALGAVGALKFNVAGTDVGSLEMERLTGDGRPSAMKFIVRSNSALFEAMRITSNASIGVGLTNPDEMFHMRNDRPGGLYLKVQNNREDMTATAGLALTTLNGIWKLNARRASGFSISAPTVADVFFVTNEGNVGIGATDTKGYKLAVNGSGAFTRVVVKAYNNWPDFVFHKDYELPTLQQVEQYVTEHQHLPGIPSAGEVAAAGVDLGDMNQKLLQKIEEQMLYIIEMNKKVELLTNEVKDLKEKVAAKQ